MKKGRMRFGAVLVMTMAFVLTASIALAGPGGWGRGMGGGGMGGMGGGYGHGGWGQGMGPGQGGYANAGSLTPEQSQKLQTMREAYLKDITPLQNQLFTKKSELRLLWSAPNPEKDQIMAKQGELNTLQQQIQEKATKHQLEVRAIVGK